MDDDISLPSLLASKDASEIISYLSELEGDIDSYKFLNNTFLNFAVVLSIPEVVRYLLEVKKASPEILNSQGIYPLHVACSSSQEIVEILLDFGANIESRCGPQNFTPLMWAFTSGNPDIETLLLDRGAIGHFEFTIK